MPYEKPYRVIGAHMTARDDNDDGYDNNYDDDIIWSGTYKRLLLGSVVKCSK